jgi:DNA-binding transcriptional MerR regulator
MLIKEACTLCGLTKKAVLYYEQQGLIFPDLLPNGYRNYSAQDIDILKEICVLRSCGLTIQQIKEILTSKHKATKLTQYRHLQELKLLQLKNVQANLDKLIQNYNVEDSFKALMIQDQTDFSIREKLIHSFPGLFGIYLSLHFGRFLHHHMENEVQREAYTKIVSYLDDLAFEMSDEQHSEQNNELLDYMEELLQLQEGEQLKQVEQAMMDSLTEVNVQPETFFERQSIADYITYRTSEEYKQTPAGKMALLLRQFQQQSGYKENFIANMKILSPSYASYYTQLEALNELFIAQHPEAKEWY